MSGRVYLVTVAVDVPVYAESEEDAERIALRHASNEMSSAGVDGVRELHVCPSDLVGCLPHGGDRRTTIDELIARAK